MSIKKPTEVPVEVLEFSSKVTGDVKDLVKNVVDDLINLKNEILDEYSEESSSKSDDLALIISKVERYTEMKAQIKEDSENILKKLYESWCQSLEDVLERVKNEVTETVNEFSLSPCDFTGVEVVSTNRNVASTSKFYGNRHISGDPISSSSPNLGKNGKASNRRHTGLYPHLDELLESERTAVLKRKRSSYSNSSPSEYPMHPAEKRSRKSVTFISPLNATYDASSSDGEENEIIVKPQEEEEEEILEEEEEEEIQEEPIIPVKSKRGRRSTMVLPVRPNGIMLDFLTSAPETVPVVSPPHTRTRRSMAKSTPAVKETTQEKKAPKKASLPNPVSLEPDDKYSSIWNPLSWYQLNSLPKHLDIPDMPAIYQIKVKQAKKSAYIGVCENLRNTLMKYKNGESSGQKQLDKFIDRNHGNVEIQCTVCSSSNIAKIKHQNQLANFRELFQKNPVFN